jgi:hypothetical protein
MFVDISETRRKVTDMNNKLLGAIQAIDAMYLAGNLVRWKLEYCISCDYVKADDDWVIVALNCVDDNDMLEMALESFLGNIKDGDYDPSPEPVS